MENISLTNKKMAKSFGMDPTSEKYQKKCLLGAANFGDKATEVVKKDLEVAQFWWNKKIITKEDVFKAGSWIMDLNTFIVKLNSGSLLLYAPVKIKDEVGFGSWVDSLGPVEWIVVAASSHTLHIQSVTERYPNAKIVGPPAAEDKLNFVNALVRKRFDYNCTDENCSVLLEMLQTILFSILLIT